MTQEELVSTNPTNWYPTWSPYRYYPEYQYPEYQYWYYPYSYSYWYYPPAIYCPYCGKKLEAHVCGE